MNDIVIRELEIKDFDHGFPDVLEVLAPVGLSKNEAIPIYTTKMPRKHQKVFVALDGETVVGTATLLIDQKFIHKGGKAAHIEDVAVLKNYQGAGIGCSLVGRCIDEARSASCYKAVLNCDGDVIGFYEKLGFRIYGNSMRYDIDAFRQG